MNDFANMEHFEMNDWSELDINRPVEFWISIFFIVIACIIFWIVIIFMFSLFIELWQL